MSDADQDDDFEQLLLYLKRSRGFDLGGYKRTSLMRRIRRRMQQVLVESFADYTDYLEVHPDEFAQLFNTILINVTGFFRDASAWDFLAQEVVPRLLKAKATGEPVRVWSAGCAGGQEAYSLAIVFAEALGLEGFRQRVKIYGTDIDAEALNQARQGAYNTHDVEEIRPEWREKYFEPNGDRRVFRKELRRSVIFGRHDLLQDAPISRLDLLVCRNTLMYFNAEAQARILDRFHFAVNDGGYLFLGKAEMLLTHGNNFVPVDLKRRVFTKVGSGVRNRLWLPNRGDPAGAASPLVNHVRLREAAFDTAAVPQVVFDLAGALALANQQARAHFGLSHRDLGRPLAELDLAHRPVELRPLVEQAAADGQPVSLKEAEWRKSPDEVEYVNVQVVPLRDAGNDLVGVSALFTNVTQQRRLQLELQRTHRELQTASEELQSTNEELETTNEELQSTNEELETMNEELQSANEELQTINEELRQRSDELNHVNAFLQSILASFRGGVVVVDRDLLVLVWNHRAEDLWGLRGEEARGKNFLNLDIGLPTEQLRSAIRASLMNEARSPELTLEAVNRRGKPIRCRVTCAPLAGTDHEARGVIMLMEEPEGERPRPGD